MRTGTAAAGVQFRTYTFHLSWRWRVFKGECARLPFCLCELNLVWAQIWKTGICVWSRAHSERSEQGASELGSTEGLWVFSRISFSGEYQNSMHTWTRAGNPIEFRTGPITCRFNSPRGVWSWCEALATFWLDLLPNKRKWKLDSCSSCDSLMCYIFRVFWLGEKIGVKKSLHFLCLTTF